MIVTPIFNFRTGEFDLGRNGAVTLVCGMDGLKNWIQKILHTPRGRYPIYGDSGYGNRLEDLLVGRSLPREYVTAEVERQVKEALLQNPEIHAVDSFDIRQDGARLEISFRVSSVYGNAEMTEVVGVG